MSENFIVEVISPSKSVLKSETKEVTLPSYEGEMGILKDHVPMITFLRPGIITIKKDNQETKFFIEEGTVEFSKNNLLILTSTAKDLSKFNQDEINNVIKISKERIDQKDISDKERYLLSYKIDVLKHVN
ncbi:ATP synthase F1 subunit epsilon [Candidatus Pelagibacter bacterium]|nr:ATP synthase F1 subunit epsilon [Candidatus Pelagibacter bacterium]